ncbi:hypothetical protein B0G80_1184 [Paraburkholderia sp. BL6669N2]|uniref:hypothetical protein n=1 Tax=Paraburkholderia sp. BL6669N2 TaxID=1938807 RepID=UPI000E28A1E8|nr:hypothetical protein [Paraburkholderia sp. BL6669N2]REG58526.1 hypothetical protein B0G80_1184 [Paraburkholderia sp. BL6669N2]
MWRDIYRLTLNPEIFVDSDNLRNLIGEAGFGSVDTVPLKVAGDVDALCDYLSRIASNCEMQLRSRIEAVGHSGNIRRAARGVFMQSAPVASALGRWLQGLSCPSNFEDQMYLKTLALLADDIGVGKPEMSRTDGFRQIARRFDLVNAAGQAHDLVADRSLRDGAFRFPAILFALSRRSEMFVPEITGLDFALRTIGLLPVWRVLAGYFDDPEWRRLDLAVPQTDVLPQGHTPTSLARHILNLVSSWGCG